MQEPSPRTSRLAIAAAFAAVVILGGGGFLLGRGTAKHSEIITLPVPPVPAVTPKTGAATGMLGRAELIALASSAADTFASGESPDKSVAAAAGRRFTLRLPFGCSGPSPEGSNASMRWRYDKEEQTLRVSVTPARWTAADWWSDDVPKSIDAIEGYWIMRPWTSSEACPVGAKLTLPVGPGPVTLAGQTLALGQIFYADGARSGQRQGKAHELVLRIAPEKLDPAAGFRLRISGRVVAMRDGKVVQCQQPAGSAQPPICLVSTDIDEVAIENPVDDETLAVWTMAKGDVAH